MIKIDKNWLRRRFWDFRQGHGTYLGYALSFVSFTTVTYALLLDRVPLLKVMFPHFHIYAVTFIIAYPILAVTVGYREFRKKQYPTDVEVATLQNPFLYKLTPGKEKEVSYPAQILRLKLEMRLFKHFKVMTRKEEQQLEKLIGTMEKLAKGETIKK